MEPNKKNILITGATGFVGKQLVQKLLQHSNYKVQASVRSVNSALPKELQIPIGNVSKQTDWTPALKGCDVVIHTAARVHIMRETATDPLQEFRKINVEGTLNLARQAATHGVKRFIFISSIKVNGEITHNDKFFADDKPSPQDPYAVSKLEAEQGLFSIAKETGLEVVIIRPPLIYGPHVKGNFRRLIQTIQKGLPLPLAALNHNKRSLVSIYNLLDLINCCIDHPNAANQVFLVSDGFDISSVELLQKIGQALNKSPWLIYIPRMLLKGISSLLGKEALWQRLGGSLQLDIEKTCTLLNWKPVIGMDEALYKTLQEEALTGCVP
ncbi:UDP-glucose 4-epimerase (Galactowaldenase) (UDP-galactose 4-epimerase) (plasmid) [Legionella adelaidensis]|uniref:GDP-6-deoxy-D-mannose reductase n=1 Tax=Legionella adelaidensis TaxID=45056 RepID=A0A0W0R4N4_9GAMM|nr:SDR family oxidoreductase [Legionella adelaidensis]KTC66032.1 GDP-6-deoxy-D-mannose reductase [Legionella adelaidensis]VEH85691.1 UDP-glucose 4-epimerase (Galactowaldenase) (UDP-galactose 4-epimerase) [Legionella adelaidensis]